MDRATKAIKRGSIRLKSYSELNLILSDLNDIRSAGKASVKAHQTFIEDLIKWAHQESNDRIKKSFTLLTELNILWSEIHNESFENLKKFRQQFELILESEQAIEKARNHASSCEQLEVKLNKDLKKSVERSGSYTDESRKLEEKLREANRASEVAKVEVTQKENENAIIKLIRIKEGLKKLTESYLRLSQKCSVIMQAQKVVVNELPDDIEVDHESQFSNECKVKHAVNKAKTVIQAMSCTSDTAEGNAPMEYEAPPPYSPYFGPSTSRSSLPSTSSGTNLSSWWQQINPGRRLIDHSGCSDQPTLYICGKCSAQMISDHRYFSAQEPDHDVATSLRNARIS